jgi:hypothetical protein
MKIIKGLVLFGFLGLGVSACFNPPEFNNRPEVIYRSTYFGDDPDPSKQDSIVIKFDFKDGDGDLGLPSAPLLFPYHQFNFFVEDGSGQISPVPSLRPTSVNDVHQEGLKSAKTGVSPTGSKFFVYNIPTSKKLVTFQSRSNGYPTLPPFAAPYSTCENNMESYRKDTVYVLTHSKNAVKQSRIVDSLLTKVSNQVFAYTVVDTFYNEVNLRQYTILVKFFEKVGNNYQEFDWRKEFCSTFDAKFQLLSDKTGPLEGTISYAMYSVGFNNIFSVKQLYLEFQIIDQAGNFSNTARTQEFTLADIKR